MGWTDADIWGPDGTAPADHPLVAGIGRHDQHPVDPKQQSVTPVETSGSHKRRVGRRTKFIIVAVAALGLAFPAVRIANRVDKPYPVVPVAVTPSLLDVSEPRKLVELPTHDIAGIVGSADGNTIFLSVGSSRMVCKVDLASKLTNVVAGSRVGPPSPASVLRNPGPLALDSQGRLIVVDNPTFASHARVLRIDPDGNAVVLATDSDYIEEVYTDTKDRVWLQMGQGEDPDIRVVRLSDYQRQESKFQGRRLLFYPDGSVFGISYNGAPFALSMFGESTTQTVPKTTLDNGDPIAQLALVGSTLITVSCFGEVDGEGCKAYIVQADGTESVVAIEPHPTVAFPQRVVRFGGGIIVNWYGGLLTLLPNVLQSGASNPGSQVVLSDPLLARKPFLAAAQIYTHTVGPDGTVFAIDRLTLIRINPRGGVERIGHAPLVGGLQATRDGLAVLRWGREQPTLVMVPYNKLTPGEGDDWLRNGLTINATSIRYGGPLRLSVDQDNRLLWVSTGSSGVPGVLSRLRTGVGALSNPTVEVIDPSQYFPVSSISAVSSVAQCDANRFVSVGASGLFVHGPEGASARVLSSPTEPSQPGDGKLNEFFEFDRTRPPDQLVSIGDIASLGKCKMLVSNPSGSSLSVAEPGAGQTWRVSQFGPRFIPMQRTAPMFNGTWFRATLAVAPDGSAVIGSADGVLRRVTQNGTVTVLAGGSDDVGFVDVSGVVIASGTRSSDAPRVSLSEVSGDRLIDLDASGGMTSVDIGTAGSAQNIVTGAVATDGRNLVYFVSPDTHEVYRFDRTVPKSGLRRVVGFKRKGRGDGVSASVQELNTPSALAASSNGSVYVADTGNNRVIQVDSKGVFSTLATVTSPGGLALLDQQTLVATSSNGGLVRIDLVTNTAQPWSATRPEESDLYRFVEPTCLASTPNQSLYVCEPATGSIWRVSSKGKRTLIAQNEALRTLSAITFDRNLGLRFITDLQVWEIPADQLER
jgi:sugar lactone lactonase YvrE